MPLLKRREGLNLSMWATTTDDGSDIKASRERMEGEVKKAGPDKWSFHGSCLNHQASILGVPLLFNMEIIMFALDLPFKFYATLARLLHLWRDNAVKFLELWRRYFQRDAEKRAKKIAPQHLSTRWLRASELACYGLGVNEDELVTVINRAFPAADDPEPDEEEG